MGVKILKKKGNQVSRPTLFNIVATRHINLIKLKIQFLSHYSHISSAQQQYDARGYWVGQCKSFVRQHWSRQVGFSATWFVGGQVELPSDYLGITLLSPSVFSRNLFTIES